MQELGRLKELASLLLQGAEGRRQARRLVGLYLLRGEADALTFRRDGVAWTIPVSDSIISSYLFKTGGFQRRELAALMRWMEGHDCGRPERDLIVDIGANIGTTAIPFALDGDRSVLALEPDPSNFTFLQANVAANHLEARVTCLQIAVSNHPGRMRMAANPASSGSTEALEPGIVPEAGTVIDVESRRLDEIVHDQLISPDRIALVWSDTEGLEWQVIDSGGSLWSLGIPLYMEVWPPGLRRHGGMAQLVSVVNQHFDTMIPSQDLRRLGAIAVPRPVGDLVEFMTTQPPHGTDVLLLPKHARPLDLATAERTVTGHSQPSRRPRIRALHGDDVLRRAHSPGN